MKRNFNENRRCPNCQSLEIIKKRKRWIKKQNNKKIKKEIIKNL